MNKFTSHIILGVLRRGFWIADQLVLSFVAGSSRSDKCMDYMIIESRY